jgi:hypothetical protein
MRRKGTVAVAAAFVGVLLAGGLVLVGHGSSQPARDDAVERVDYDEPAPYGWTWGIQAGNAGTDDAGHHDTSFDVVADPAGNRGRVARIWLPPRNSGGRAAEGLLRRHIDLGRTDYYRLSIRVPRGWHTLYQDSEWHTLIAQFNYVGLGGPPVGVVITPSALLITMTSGQVRSDANGTVTGYGFQANLNRGKRLYLLRRLPEAQWVDMLVGITWATTPSGRVRGWVRLPDQKWALAVDTLKRFGRGVPTQQWGYGEGRSITIDGIDRSTGEQAVTADKAGLYAGPGRDPLQVWESPLVRTTTAKEPPL